jgi:Flp pilus assembly protein TadG
MAMILIPLVMTILGIFEFSRLLLDWNLLNNAARECCRYALVNNTASTISTDVTNIAKARMGTETRSFTNLTITVSGTHNGVSTAVNNLAAGDMITMTITGNYKFLNNIPFVTMPKFTMSSSVAMVCEGGM